MREINVGDGFDGKFYTIYERGLLVKRKIICFLEKVPFLKPIHFFCENQ